MKKCILFLLMFSLVFAQNELLKDSISIDDLATDSINNILDSLSTPLDSAQTVSPGEVNKTEQTLRIVENFYATGLNNRGFFLSRNIPPKVRLENKSNMLFSFFTTSCIPCRKEIPFIARQIKKHNIPKAYIVNIGEPKEHVQKYIDHYQYNINVLLDPYGIVAKKLEVITTPVLIVISGDGELLYRHNGFMEADTTEILEVFNNYFEMETDEF